MASPLALGQRFSCMHGDWWEIPDFDASAFLSFVEFVGWSLKWVNMRAYQMLVAWVPCRNQTLLAWKSPHLAGRFLMNFPFKAHVWRHQLAIHRESYASTIRGDGQFISSHHYLPHLVLVVNKKRLTTTLLINQPLGKVHLGQKQSITCLNVPE